MFGCMTKHTRKISILNCPGLQVGGQINNIMASAKSTCAGLTHVA
jgi:hypothetical protein